ncbi:hypothetical protein KM043_013139 [Ampulex compressa]|nr:hypothetical protein KM043_013139 [Ampulex compressa]
MGLAEREAEMQELETQRPGRSRDLFGVQLEVTSLLLEGERRKLAVLQRELQVALAEGGSVKVKEKQRQELLHAISKIQGQHEQLDKEYRIHAAGVLLCNSRGSGKGDIPQFVSTTDKLSNDVSYCYKELCNKKRKFESYDVGNSPEQAAIRHQRTTVPAKHVLNDMTERSFVEKSFGSTCPFSRQTSKLGRTVGNVDSSKLKAMLISNSR